MRPGALECLGGDDCVLRPRRLEESNGSFNKHGVGEFVIGDGFSPIEQPHVKY